MNSILGLIFHTFGGIASGSFYIPYKKVKGWSFETYWLIGGFFSWLIIPYLAALITIPNFATIINNTDFKVIVYAYSFGFIWGIGGLAYGLAVRYLGVSLGSSIVLGLCMVFGSLIPAIYYDYFKQTDKTTITYLFTTTSGLTVIGGLLLCLIGVCLCGKAGMQKDKQININNVKQNNEFKFLLGISVAIISGIFSACFNFGIEAAKPMADVANNLWIKDNPNKGNFLFQNNVSYIIILLGGLTTNLIWCLYQNIKHKSYTDYTNFKNPILKNILFCAIAGTMWFLQFFFYGMGESKLGNGPSSWILHMATIILTANVCGLLLNEWKQVNKKTIQTLIIGVVLILLSVIVVGIGNS